MAIDFGVWAPDEQTFWQSWIDAGIGNFYDDDNNVTRFGDGQWRYAPEYRGIQTTTSWSGIITKTPAVLDENGEVVTPAVLVPGWHTNVRVYGKDLIAQFTQGLEQQDEDGNLKRIWDRTHAARVFGLQYKEADAATGFPAGYRNVSSGVTYADIADFSSPANVWA